MRPQPNEAVTNVSLRVLSLLSEHASSAPLAPERGICAIAFDATGGDVHLGPMLNHLGHDEACDASDYFIAAALDIIGIDPSVGVMLIQYDSATTISAFFIADASLSVIERSGSSLH